MSGFKERIKTKGLSFRYRITGHHLLTKNWTDVAYDINSYLESNRVEKSVRITIEDRFKKHYPLFLGISVRTSDYKHDESGRRYHDISSLPVPDHDCADDIFTMENGDCQVEKEIYEKAVSLAHSFSNRLEKYGISSDIIRKAHSGRNDLFESHIDTVIKKGIQISN